MSNAVNDLLNEYADVLDDVYERRTAGDFTFLGILANYTMKLKEIQDEEQATEEASRQPEADRPAPSCCA